jgi:hypothetical protein
MLPLWNGANRLDTTANLSVRRRAWQAFLEFVQKYAEQFPRANENQSDLAVSYNKMGDLAVAAGDGDAARDWFGKGLAIRARLATLMPESLIIAEDLAISCIKLASLRQTIDDGTKLLHQAVDILLPFIAAGRATPRTKQIYDYVSDVRFQGSGKVFSPAKSGDR